MSDGDRCGTARAIISLARGPGGAVTRVMGCAASASSAARACALAAHSHIVRLCSRR